MTKAWAVLAAALAVALGATVRVASAAPLPAGSFLYQISNVDPMAIGLSAYDMVILDPSRDGTSAGDWTPQEIADLKATGKTVLALVRIGEAESSRFYWDPAWDVPETRPAWLGPQVADETGVYRVKYWDPAWQQLILGPAGSYVDRVLAQGFDGIVLDAVDAYLYWGPAGKLPASQRNNNAPQDMIAFVEAVAASTRQANSEYPVLPQSGYDLLADDGYLATVSGVVAESLWFDGNKRQKTKVTRVVIPLIDRVVRTGRPVYAISYPTSTKNIDIFYDRATSKGCVPLVTTRERDVLAMQARHPPGLPPTLDLQTPLANIDGYQSEKPTFTWTDAGADPAGYRVNFSGSEARQQVYTFPKKAPLSGTSYTPTASEWKLILNQARLNQAGKVYWWVSANSPTNVIRSTSARVLHRMHPLVPTTVFWVGAEPGAAGPDSRTTSAWDSDWVNHFGGVDVPFTHGIDPDHPYWPDFTPLENPFYVALPYNDFTAAGARRGNFDLIVPWAPFQQYGPLDSAVKNHWIRMKHNGAVCYAQWEDVGPWQTNDFRYVFGIMKPKNKKNLGAGLEVSPAVRDCLGMLSIGAVSWRFVHDDETVPPGPWTEIVTTSQITP